MEGVIPVTHDGSRQERGGRDDGSSTLMQSSEPHSPALEEPCPLCEDSHAALLHRAAARSFWRCGNCGLIFVPAGERLGAAAEKARYDLHENDPADLRFQQFLEPLSDAVLRATKPDAEGLDFGCGPGSALATMLRRAGRGVSLFDPYYALDEKVWTRTYDFVVASEVFEHLYQPRRELDRLFRVLRPGGALGIMTRMAPASADDFAAWHYHRDPTHVCFYSRRVFAHIAATWGTAVDFPAGNVVLLTHPMC